MLTALVFCRGERKEDSTLLGEYAQTKLMNIMIAKEMNRRLEGTNVDVIACQPGDPSCLAVGYALLSGHAMLLKQSLLLSDQVF